MWQRLHVPKIAHTFILFMFFFLYIYLSKTPGEQLDLGRNRAWRHASRMGCRRVYSRAIVGRFWVRKLGWRFGSPPNRQRYACVHVDRATGILFSLHSRRRMQPPPTAPSRWVCSTKEFMLMCAILMTRRWGVERNCISMLPTYTLPSYSTAASTAATAAVTRDRNLGDVPTSRHRSRATEIDNTAAAQSPPQHLPRFGRDYVLHAAFAAGC